MASPFASPIDTMATTGTREPLELIAPEPPAAVGMTERERIGNTDERQRVGDTDAVPYRWLCSIDVTYPGNDPDRHGRGSGVLVGPRHVLTAAHCIYRTRDAARPESLSVAPGRNGATEPIGRFKAVAYSVSNAYLGDLVVAGRRIPGPRENSRFDIGLVTLERNVADVVHHREQDARPYGHWGHVHEGRFTYLRGLDAAFLAGKPVTVAGYPGDRCGTVPFDARTCDQTRDLATVPFAGPGVVAVDHHQPGLLLHTADTHLAQSGSPVWMKFGDGTRYLVGIHTGPGVRDAVTRRALNNRAVHLSPEMVALVRSWMPGVNVL